MKTKKLNMKLLYVMSTLLILTMCSFFRPVISHAEEHTPVMRSVNVDISGNDIPEELKNPINKGTMLLGWLVIAMGAMAVLAGLILIAFDKWSGGGHAGAGATGIKVAVIGGVLILAPIILSWLLPGFNLTY